MSYSYETFNFLNKNIDNFILKLINLNKIIKKPNYNIKKNKFLAYSEKFKKKEYHVYLQVDQLMH